MACNWRKKKWYNWTVGHCFHCIDGSEKKTKNNCKDTCNFSTDPYIVWDYTPYINIVQEMKCCWCDETTTVKLIEHNITKASNYPDIDE